MFLGCEHQARIWLVAGLLLVACPASLLAQQTFRVVGVHGNNSLNVHAAPQAGAKINGSIPASATGIRQIGECKTWCHVQLGELAGWVDRRFLQSEVGQPNEAVQSTRTNPIEDCNSDDPRRLIDGCGQLILRGGLSPADLAVAYSRRSDGYLTERLLDDAIWDRLKAVELEPSNQDHKKRLAYAYRLRAATAAINGKPHEAVPDYGASIRLDPSDADGYAGRGEAFVQLKDIDKGLVDLRQAAALNPAGLYTSQIRAALVARSDAHLLSKSFDQAIADLTEAIRVDAGNARLLGHRGAAYAAKGDNESALKDLSEAIQRDATDAGSYLRRGMIYRTQSRLREALADFDRAIQHDRRNVTALVMRGRAREESGRRDEAIGDFRVALQLDPSNAGAKDGLARLGSTPPPHEGGTAKDGRSSSAATADPNEHAGLRRFDGTWSVMARSQDCKLRPDGSYVTTSRLEIDNGVVSGTTRVGAKVSGRVTDGGKLAGSFPAPNDGGTVRFHATLRGTTGSGSFSRPDGKCEGTLTMRRNALPVKQAALPSAPAIQPAKRTFVGRWYGEIKGLNDKRIGDYRTLTITSVSAEGTVDGRWGGASGSGGQGTRFHLSTNALIVTTTYGNRVALRHASADRLVGTFTVTKTGKQHAVVLQRK